MYDLILNEVFEYEYEYEYEYENITCGWKDKQVINISNELIVRFFFFLLIPLVMKLLLEEQGNPKTGRVNK